MKIKYLTEDYPKKKESNLNKFDSLKKFKFYIK